MSYAHIGKQIIVSLIRFKASSITEPIIFYFVNCLSVLRFAYAYQGSTHRLVRAPVEANLCDIFRFFRCWCGAVLRFQNFFGGTSRFWCVYPWRPGCISGLEIGITLFYDWFIYFKRWTWCSESCWFWEYKSSCPIPWKFDFENFAQILKLRGLQPYAWTNYIGKHERLIHFLQNWVLFVEV